MTCFWTALIAGLPSELFQLDTHIGASSRPRRMDPSSFVSYLQSHNKETPNVQINKKFLNKQRMEENFEAVRIYDKNSMYDGYWCAAEDPFIFFVSELFQINIHHNFCGHTFIYTFVDSESKVSASKTLYLRSSNGHMSFAGFR
jgi:hypothetical protein